MTTAWVLPGGASLGAVQVGQAAALMRAGMAPDVVVGVSVGALNAAHIAADPTVAGVERLAGLWRAVRRRNVFPLQPVALGCGLAGRRDHMVSARPLTAWLEAHLPYRRLEEARLPLIVTATDLLTGDAVQLSSGPLIPSLLASCAIPGIFPPVQLGGRSLVDGGLAVASSVEVAAARGADRIVVLPTHGLAPARPHGPCGVLLRSVSVVLDRIREGAGTQSPAGVEVFVAPAPTVRGTSPFGFGHTAELMAAAERLTAAWCQVALPVGVGAGAH